MSERSGTGSTVIVSKPGSDNTKASISYDTNSKGFSFWIVGATS